MKEIIRQRARDLGFDACGFAPANAPSSAPRFLHWLASGRQGEMAYMDRTAAKRIDPNTVLPGVRTVIALAASYHTPEIQPAPVGETARPQTPTSVGVIARYARYRDYHSILGPRLDELARGLVGLSCGTAQCRVYVDTGPVLERDFAQRAGVGFIGKHTNLISRSLGNWLFLGEILTTLDLPPDHPEPNRCGTCERCLHACPTQAIVAPFQLDARRCISYLTVELKGPIPLEFRKSIGDRIFGCDDCLAACPWNRFAQAGRLMADHRRPDLGSPELIALLNLDQPGFRKLFAGTPIERLKLPRLKRNVCVALGNVGTVEALPDLATAAAASDPLVAEHARWAIGQIQLRATRDHHAGSSVDVQAV